VPVGYPGSDWSPASWLGSEYANLMMRWLTSPGLWYRAEPICDRNWPLIRLKMLAILNEHLFGIRAHEQGVALVGYKQFAGFKHLPKKQGVIQRRLDVFRRHPFMSDDRGRTPEFRLYQVAGVLYDMAGLDRLAETMVRRTVAQHYRDHGSSLHDEERNASPY
jgi:hypothetical protein